MTLRDRAFQIFTDMQPGDVIDIRNFAKKDPDGFIQFGKDWIDQGNTNYEFSPDYRKFRRMVFDSRVILGSTA